MQQDQSFRIFAQCIDVQQVRAAREALTTYLQSHSPLPAAPNERLMVHVFDTLAEWPAACQVLLQAVKEAIPFHTIVPQWPNVQAKVSLSIYQGIELVGRGPLESYIYTISLEETLGPQNGMPEYIQHSHSEDDNAAVRELPHIPVVLQQGDVLVWKGKTAFYASGQGSGGKFMFIRIFPTA